MLWLSTHAARLDAQVVTPADVRADLSYLLAKLDSLHPATASLIDRSAVDHLASSIGADLSRDMSRQEAWAAMARLNPLLGDGHTLVQFPELATQLAAFTRDGGRLLPDVFWIDQAGQLVLRRRIAGMPPGTRVLAVDGTPGEQVVAAMLERAHGDSPSFRRALVSTRFPALYWLLHGGQAQYRLKLRDRRGNRTITLAGSSLLPATLRPEVPFASLFSSVVLPGRIGYVRVASFDGAYLDEFRAFSARVFAAFRRAGVRDVIVDVRDNPGGDDVNWTTGLAPYFAGKAFRTFGEAHVRVTPENADPGDVIGSVQTIVARRTYPSSADTPDRVQGTTYLLAGTSTYSAAMLLLTTAQDQELAVIAGQPTGGRSCTTGRVVRVALPRTGLVAFIPTVYFIRPSKAGCSEPVTPSLLIADDPFDPQHSVRELAAAIRKRRP